MSQQTQNSNPGEASPLSDFAHCHEGILSHLDALTELPSLAESALRARTLAEQTLQFFQRVVFDHHVEEEKDLFPAVISAAAKGEEHDRVQRMIDALTHEHRVVESLWRDVEPQLSKLAKGHIAAVDATSVQNLVGIYNSHARFEEQEFLPAAEVILGRKDPNMAELGLSLHLRHAVRAARRGLQGS